MFVQKTIFPSILSTPVAAPPTSIDTISGGDLVVTTRSYPTLDGIVQMTRMHPNGTEASVTSLAESGMPFVNHDLLVEDTNGTARVLVSSPNIVYVNQHPAVAWSPDGATVYFVVQDNRSWTIDSVPYTATSATPTVLYATADQLGSIEVTADSIYVKDELTDKIARLSLGGTLQHLLGPAIGGDAFAVSGTKLFRWNPSTNDLSSQGIADETTVNISQPQNVVALSASAGGDPVVLTTGASTLVAYAADGTPSAFGPPPAPADVAVSSSGAVYFTNAVEGKVYSYNVTSGLATAIASGIGSTISGTVDDNTVPSPFHTSHPAPMPLAIASNGDLYVGDLGAGRVDRIHGATVSQLPGTFTSPTGLRVDGSRLIVADAVAHRTTIEGLDGSSPVTYSTTIGTTTLDPRLTTPIPGSTDRITIDNFRYCVVRSSATGTNATALISVDVCTGPAESGLFGATSAVVSSDGYVYVADAGKNRIVRMKTDGTGFEVIATSINYPEGLTLDGQGNLWVAARGGLFEVVQAVTISANRNPVQRSTPVVVTATLGGTGTSIFGGTMAFKSNGVAIPGCGAVVVRASSASCQVSFSTLGTMRLTAAYKQSVSVTLTSPTLLEQVLIAPMSVAVHPSRTTVPHGVAMTLRAQMTSSATFGAVSSGLVTFYDGRAAIRGCTSIAVHAGAAACSTALSVRGSHGITARYLEGVRWANATSPAVSIKAT